MKPVLPVLCVLFALGCAHDQPAAPPPTTPVAPTTLPALGSRVTWRGVAVNHKVGAFLAGPGIYVDVAHNHWPTSVHHKQVEVTGTVAERFDLPVFIHDPDEPPVGGIPVPPGTDLRRASRRLILEDVKWTVVPRRRR